MLLYNHFLHVIRCLIASKDKYNDRILQLKTLLFYKVYLFNTS